MSVRAGLTAALLLTGCAGPIPSITPSPTPPADPESAAEAVGVTSEALVPIEEGFVVADFNDADVLQLVWVRATDGRFATEVLATLDDRSPADVATTSAYPIICPPDAGLTRTRFVVGEITGFRELTMNGAAANGGQIVDDAYAFAFAPTEAPPTDWALVGATGEELVTSDPAWFTEPEPSPADDDLCSVVRE